MKKQNRAQEALQLTPLSQSRLVAYTTAASLGAFFTSQSADAQVVESPAFAPYPATILPPPAAGGIYITNGPNGFSGAYHYFTVDSNTVPELCFTINAPTADPPTGPHNNQFLDIFGLNGGKPLTPTYYSSTTSSGYTTNAYLVPFLGGTTINSNSAGAPTYQPRLAIAYIVKNPYGYYKYLDTKYTGKAALGFQFVGAADHQTHFGYMDVKVNSSTNSDGYYVINSFTVYDVYYNATANAGITVPIEVTVSDIEVTNEAVTINFTSNDNADPTLFVLQSSPTLGASATWTDDTTAVITQTIVANLARGIDLAIYQAVTTAAGAPARYYRIKHL
jgi:hypothetical protein